MFFQFRKELDYQSVNPPAFIQVIFLMFIEEKK